MKKRFKIILFSSLILFLASSTMSCYGNFVLTRKIYHWNGGLGDKFVNTAVMWVLLIVPVYEVVGLIDFVILNTLEFWTGKNPVAMGPHEKETQIVKIEGKEFEITATQNRLDIKPLENKHAPVITMIYDAEKETWFYYEKGIKKLAAQLDESRQNVILFQPDGRKVLVKI